MKHRSLCTAIMLTVLAGLSQVAWPAELFQVSTFASFANGQYDGPVTFRELKQNGNTGIGTVNGLYGEMIAVDGRFFQIRDDGKVYEISDSELTPFATISSITAGTEFSAKANNADELHAAIDARIPDRSAVYVMRIDGLFSKLKLRSVPKQSKPYPALNEVIKKQAIFEHTNVRGTLVGFRFPDFMNGVNVPGYHFHFISDDRTIGGHMLDCSTEEAQGSFETVSQLNVRLIGSN
ncbi:acetolactate decarboxylase [Desulfomonile tiedjei]|uniref:Alpha-acetolactate decarboxylase n=1 Tax=Desulfomonile tiedjei (strain ATCC 49306 / DSM 6799 / DCB-1) TaxID=706587 RepID=I4CBC3_DESTA|nr:acetolactate decarboxylase [Desulfomonile tiedjei]AFM26864.1 alpha-acetolactate decarboxylase [Desulfomonile tiedjei DSM 6799]